jgi:hypothetical protein
MSEHGFTPEGAEGYSAHSEQQPMEQQEGSTGAFSTWLEERAENRTNRRQDFYNQVRSGAEAKARESGETDEAKINAEVRQQYRETSIYQIEKARRQEACLSLVETNMRRAFACLEPETQEKYATTLNRSILVNSTPNRTLDLS